MTDNEKRAHDLALMIAHSMMPPVPLSEDVNAKQLSTEPYKNYISAYSVVLKLLEEDFPSDK